MTADEIRRGLNVLRHYYAHDGQPYALNDAQLAVYLDGLRPFGPAELESAARTWMRTARWFPKLCDLLTLLAGPQVSPEAAAHLAWTTFERSLRRAGAYRGATFVDGAIGETARQVFGSFASACAFDLDSPGWAIRRQTFLAVYPTFHGRVGGPVTLHGLHAHESPVVIGHVEGLPLLEASHDEDRELTAAEATAALTQVRDRFLARTRSEAS
jgi:hypothetical protein